jgi:hypothetical protein
MNIKKIFLWIIILVPIVAVVGFSVWAYTPLGPMPEALEALESTPGVEVDENSLIVFTPVDEVKRTGLIIYPGGRVDPRSYAPAANQIAESGFLTVIVPMPFNLAVFGAEKASTVIDQFPEIDRWVVAGHSLGGSMAARYAVQNPDTVDGLVLWAGYPAEGDDLSKSSLTSASIFGSNDGLITDQDILASISLLSASNLFQMIDGGNHAQFGWYGDQAGDNPAGITRDEQQKMVVETTIDILNKVSLSTN